MPTDWNTQKKKPHYIRLITAFQTLLSFVSMENILLCMSKVRTGGKRCRPSGEADLKNASVINRGYARITWWKPLPGTVLGPWLHAAKKSCPKKNSANCPI